MSWKQHQDVVTQENTDGAFLLHMQTGVYFGLDPVGKSIWTQLKTPLNEKQVCDFLVNTYEITEDQAAQDCSEFLNNLKENELIVEA